MEEATNQPQNSGRNALPHENIRQAGRWRKKNRHTKWEGNEKMATEPTILHCRRGGNRTQGEVRGQASYTRWILAFVYRYGWRTDDDDDDVGVMMMMMMMLGKWKIIPIPSFFPSSLCLLSLCVLWGKNKPNVREDPAGVDTSCRSTEIYPHTRIDRASKLFCGSLSSDIPPSAQSQ